jgi:hypothetical protein
MSWGRRRWLLGAVTLAGRGAFGLEVPAPVLVMRHAQTDPGVGDPPGFVLARCETQRNLSEAGRAQAFAFGQALARRGWRPQRLRSSRWCRCLDSARLLAAGLGAPALTTQTWPALDSFFDDREREGVQTSQLQERLLSLHTQPGSFELWVTHQVNVTALVGLSIGMGQALWLDRRADAPLVVRPFEA